MLQERRNKIIEEVRQNGIVRVGKLTEEFGVSIETIRRDLEYLEKHNYLERVYGGAMLRGYNAQEPPYDRREIAHEAEKKQIAAFAAQLISDGDTLFVDVGTTVVETVKQLAGKKNLTVITNSIYAAQAAVSNPACRVILLGGDLRQGEFSVSGHLCGSNLENFYANKALIGVGGISIKNGVTDYHIEEANIRRLMIAHAEKVIAVADSSKFGVVAMNRVCALDSIDILVTDAKFPAADADAYRAKGLTVYLAG